MKRPPSRCDRGQGGSAPAFAFEPLEDRRLLAGFTLLTHGFQADGEFPLWLTRMSQEIAERLGGSVAEYQLTVTDDDGIDTGPDTLNRRSVLNLKQTSSGEIVLALDWAERSNDFLPGGADGTISTGGAVALDADEWILGKQNDWGEWLSLIELPIHMIGHSRGASVISELSRLIAGMGVWIDQMTFLDAHPLVAWQDEFVETGEEDPAVRVYNNVLFADAYWRKNLNPADFNGQPIGGAASHELSQAVFGAGGYMFSHSDVHLWYFGTVETTGYPSNNDKNIPGDWWYQGEMGPRDVLGYNYSMRAGTQGLPIRGLHPLLGGEGSRVPVARNGPQWPNVAAVLPEFSILAVGSLPRIGFLHGDADSESTVELFLDEDRNPYNNQGPVRIASATYASTGDGIAQDTLVWDTGGFGAYAGKSYYIYAKASDGGRVRYSYSPTKIYLKAVADDHPNEQQWGSARPIKLDWAAGDGARRGAVESSGDTDLFFFVAPASGSASVSMECDGGLDGRLLIYGPSKNLLVDRDYGGPNSTESASFSVQAGKTYYVVADGYKTSTGAYRIVVDAPVPDRTPPTVSFLNASPGSVSPGMTLTLTAYALNDPSGIGKATGFLDWNDNRKFDQGVDIPLAGEFTRIPGTNNWTWSGKVSPNWGSGPTTFCLSARDTANNWIAAPLPAATVTIIGAGPRILEMTAGTDVVTHGDWLFLQARVQDDNTVQSVYFYYDKNGDGKRNWYEQKWAAVLDSGVWRVGQQANWLWGEGPDPRAFRVGAVDSNGDESAKEFADSIRINGRPNGGGLSMSGYNVWGGSLTFTLASVSDDVAPIQRVDMFIDVNGNGVLDNGDIDLGAGKKTWNGGYEAKWTVPFNFPKYQTVRIMARALDSDGRWDDSPSVFAFYIV